MTGAKNVLRRWRFWNRSRVDSNHSGAEADQSDYRIQTSLVAEGIRFSWAFTAFLIQTEVGGSKLCFVLGRLGTRLSAYPAWHRL